MIVAIRTNVTPDITINLRGNDKPVTGLSRFLKNLIQPSITIPGLSYSPYGTPSTMGGAVFAVLILVFIAGLYFIAREIV